MFVLNYYCILYLIYLSCKRVCANGVGFHVDRENYHFKHITVQLRDNAFQPVPDLTAAASGEETRHETDSDLLGDFVACYGK